LRSIVAKVLDFRLRFDYRLITIHGLGLLGTPKVLHSNGK